MFDDFERKHYMVSAISIIVIVTIIFIWTPTGRQIWFNDQAEITRVEELTYENRKDVEDTCRSMIVSYKSDVDIYNLYKDSTFENQRAYADTAKNRALEKAQMYNEYMLKNSYVWEGNIPVDIPETLDTDF